MEIDILLKIQELRNVVLDFFFKYFTILGNHGEIWIAILVVLLFFKKTRKIAIVGGVLLLIEFALVDGVLKNIFSRPRPFTEYDIELLIKAPSGFSFPSGHTASSFTVAGFLFFSRLNKRWIYIVLASLMAFSRLYLFVHYPTDILAGMIIGLVIAYLGHLVYKKIFDEIKQ